MKKIIAMARILLFILLLTSPAFAQVIIIPKAKNGLPEDANTIAIMIQRNTYHAFENTEKALIRRGYSLAKSNRDSGIIQTDYKRIKENVWLRITATVDPRVVELRGTVSADSKNGHEVVNRGRKGSPNLVGFTEMNKVAGSLPNIYMIEHL